MKLFQRDLPLSMTHISHQTPLFIGLLVFLMSLVFLGATTITTSMQSWQASFSNTLIVEIPHQTSPTSPPITKSPKVLRTLKILAALPGATQPQVIGTDTLAKLIRPWIENSRTLKEDTLPVLIQVSLKPGSYPNIAKLQSRLRAIAPGAHIDTHDAWQTSLWSMMRFIQVIAFFITFLLAGGIIATIRFITRTTVGLHRNSIDVLQLIGATDRFIARQFEGQAFLLALKGSALGVIITFPVLYLISWFFQSTATSVLLKLEPSKPATIGIIILPLIVAILSKITARISIYKAIHSKKKYPL